MHTIHSHIFHPPNLETLPNLQNHQISQDPSHFTSPSFSHKSKVLKLTSLDNPAKITALNPTHQSPSNQSPRNAQFPITHTLQNLSLANQQRQAILQQLAIEKQLDMLEDLVVKLEMEVEQGTTTTGKEKEKGTEEEKKEKEKEKQKQKEKEKDDMAAVTDSLSGLELEEEEENGREEDEDEDRYSEAATMGSERDEDWGDEVLVWDD
ncbi:hypothetical protein BZA77DRAFT_295625 [Pyronema omphalodes]|nr:hypothetical protein BZA77DRAFT_295625 [Pyronema omphalodes]